MKELARPTGVEPVASRLEVSRSIQLSYGRANPEIPLAAFARCANREWIMLDKLSGI